MYYTAVAACGISCI